MAVTARCGMQLMLLSVIFFIPAAAIIIYVQSAPKPSDYGHLLTAAYLLLGAGAIQFFTALCIFQFLKADARSDRALRDGRGNITTARTAGVAVSSHRSVASTPDRGNYGPPQSYEQATQPPRRPPVTGRYPVAPPLVPHMDHSPRRTRRTSPVPPSAPPQHTTTQDTCEAPPPSYEEAMRTMV